MKQVRFAVYMKAFVLINTENGLEPDGSNIEEYRKAIEDKWSVEGVIEHSKATNWDAMSIIEEVISCGLEDSE